MIIVSSLQILTRRSDIILNNTGTRAARQEISWVSPKRRLHGPEQVLAESLPYELWRGRVFDRLGVDSDFLPATIGSPQRFVQNGKRAMEDLCLVGPDEEPPVHLP